MMLIDTHCHLEMLGNEKEIEDIIRRASEIGLEMMVTIGTDYPSSEKASELAKKYRNVFGTVGIHPHEVKSAEPEILNKLKQLIHQNPKIKGIGETGLDFYYDHSPREIQKTFFVKHIDLARKTQLPIVVHSRNASIDTIQILRKEKAEEVGGIIHCFTENMEMATQALELDFFISFSGIITFNNTGELQEVVARIPLDRILIETDSPFLSPVPFRGKKNEPMRVKQVAEKIAEIRKISYEEVVTVTAQNAKRVFNLS